MNMCLIVFSLWVTREPAGLRKRDCIYGHSVSPLAAPVWEHKLEHLSFWWLPCLTLCFYFENFPIIPSSFLPLICHFYSGIKHIPRRLFRSLCFNSVSLEKSHCALISKWLFSASSLGHAECVFYVANAHNPPEMKWWRESTKICFGLNTVHELQWL